MGLPQTSAQSSSNPAYRTAVGLDWTPTGDRRYGNTGNDIALSLIAVFQSSPFPTKLRRRPARAPLGRERILVLAWFLNLVYVAILWAASPLIVFRMLV